MEFSFSTTEGMNLNTNLESLSSDITLSITSKYLQTTNKKYPSQLPIYTLPKETED